MRRQLLHLRLPAAALLAAVLATPGAMSATTATTTAAAGITAGHSANAAARPVPASAGHVLAQTLSFPPDDTYCQSRLGIDCYQPAQYQKAYDLAPLFAKGITGAGETIVIVDAYGSPTIGDDLTHFDATFGLPDPPSLRVIQPAGPVGSFPPSNDNPVDASSWALETTLDVEYSHVIAPGADILLVETPVAETEGVQGFPEIVEAENYVVDHDLGDVISMSLSATEQTFPDKQSLLDLRSAFVNAAKHHVAVLAATGDYGAANPRVDGSCCFDMPTVGWPASDPLVTAIGGTQMHLDAAGNRTAPDQAWNDTDVFGPVEPGATGGGLSTVFTRPDFQNDKDVKALVGNARGIPDISMSAAVDGAAVFYYSFCDYERKNPSTGVPPLCGPQWHLVGGTSEATPLFAGIVALADQVKKGRIDNLNKKIYDLGKHEGDKNDRSGLVDVTTKDNTTAFCSANCGDDNEVDTTVQGYAAGPGYDLVTGWGTVDAATFVPALAR